MSTIRNQGLDNRQTHVKRIHAPASQSPPVKSTAPTAPCPVRVELSLVRDFFKFLAEEPDKDYYLALGSSQRVTVKKRFQPKAKKAYNRCLEAIADEGKAAANKKWRQVFGRAVPLETTESARRSATQRSSSRTFSQSISDTR